MRRTADALLVTAVALLGSVLGLLLGSRTPVEVGPFHAELRVAPTVAGDTSVRIPPLGALHLDTHQGPAGVTLHLGALDQARAQALVDDPGGIARAAETVVDDVVQGVIRLGFGSLGAGVLGAMILSALVFRDVRRVAWAGSIALVTVGGSLGTAVATFQPDAIDEPRYEGLLVNAPALVGDVQQIADDYERYTEQLQQIVGNVSTLYTAASTLESFSPDEDVIRALHVSDLHLNPSVWPLMRTVTEQYDVDLIVDTGDLVDWGTGPESQYLDSIGLMGVPYVFVRGNHDSALTEEAVAEQPNAVVLDDQIATVEGLTIAGIGDPRFTPDQRTRPFDEGEQTVAQQNVVDSGAALADTVRAYPDEVDLAAVHDPVQARRLTGEVPLALAGHSHDRRVGPVTGLLDGGQEAAGQEEAQEQPDSDTLLMVQGSTGGAGLRGLQGEHPESLAMSVLYFDTEQTLIAYDDITVGGHGLSEASVQRHLVDESLTGAGEDATPSPGTDTAPPPGD